MAYRRLYIIGNGFDIFHCINSRYSQFKDWLQEHEDKYKAMYLIYNHFQVDSDFWYDFENNLSKFDVEGFAEYETRENYPDYSSEHFAREWDMATFQSFQDFSNIVHEINHAFHDWICSLNAPNPDRIVNLHVKDGFFINFNYTKTLENLYCVPASQICHLHGCVDLDENFILGHGKSVIDDVKNDSPNDCTSEIKEDFYNSHYDPIFNDVKQVTIKGINTLLKKDVKGIIKKLSNLFDGLNELEEIHICGWSFSHIDTPYLEEILKRNDPSRLKWTISWHDEKDKRKAQAFLVSHSVMLSNVNFVRMDDLINKSQLSLILP